MMIKSSIKIKYQGIEFKNKINQEKDKSKKNNNQNNRNEI
jgi:hypothetical protein